jgi:hypothetical protein
MNAFLATLDLSEFRIAVDQRKGLARKLKELQAANVATAKALGVSDETMRRDVVETTNVVLEPADVRVDAVVGDSETTDVEPGPAWFQDDLDPARLSKVRAARKQRERDAELRRAGCRASTPGVSATRFS